MTEGKRTRYIVLRQFGVEEQQWLAVGITNATSAKAAIAQCVAETSGEYVAVPERSFQPVQVTVAQKATLSFGEPSKPEPSA